MTEGLTAEQAQRYTLPSESSLKVAKKKQDIIQAKAENHDDLLHCSQLTTEVLRAIATQRGLEKEATAKQDLEKKNWGVYTQNIRYLPKVTVLCETLL